MTIRNKNLLAEQYQVIHYFIPKNACTTMKTQFAALLGMPKPIDNPQDIHRWELYQFPMAKREEHLTKYKNFLRFTIVRNPWERLVSCYKSKIEGRNKRFFKNAGTRFYEAMSFAEFVEVVCSIPDEAADPHFCGQLFLMTDSQARFCPNYLCNIESLTQHIAFIKNKTGIPLSIAEKLNSTKNFNYQSYYTPDLVEKVRTRFLPDVNFFQYEFGKRNERFPFGYLEEALQNELLDADYMSPVFRGKNIQLLSDLKKMENSLSWKIAALGRSAINFFQSGTKT